MSKMASPRPSANNHNSCQAITFILRYKWRVVVCVGGILLITLAKSIKSTLLISKYYTYKVPWGLLYFFLLPKIFLLPQNFAYPTIFSSEPHLAISNDWSHIQIREIITLSKNIKKLYLLLKLFTTTCISPVSLI